MNLYKPNISILAEAQTALWPKLTTTPHHFILYGGTALALRFGHRASIDFDFFSNHRFNPRQLQRSIDYLTDGAELQSSANTLTVDANTEFGKVQCSYFGDLGVKQIHTPDIIEDNRIRIASTLDIFGMKCATVYQRAEYKDYVDILAIINRTNYDLADGLAAANAIYGNQYNPMMTLQALTYTQDLTPQLTEKTSLQLNEYVAAVKLSSLPVIIAPHFIGHGVDDTIPSNTNNANSAEDP